MSKQIKLPKFKDGIKSAIDTLCNQIIEFTHGTGAMGGVVGLSGGIDSTTVAFLCDTAFKRFNKNKEEKDHLKLYGVSMPSIVNDKNDSRMVIKFDEYIDIETCIISIQTISDSFMKTGLNKYLRNYFDTGNLYSEIRAIILSRIAAGKNCRVMGTGNREEDIVLGYFTKRGDGAVDNNIFGNTPKRLVREIGKHLGVPKEIVEKTPTAGLWKDQTDEGELGYSYDTAEIVWEHYISGYDTLEINKMTSYDVSLIEDILQRNASTEHKRETPPSGKVSFSY